MSDFDSKNPLLDDDGDTREWLITYADMVTLLLTFFVMLLAISTLDTERFEKVLTSIQFTLGAETAPGGRLGRLDTHEVRRRSLATPTGTENEPLLKDLRQVVDKKNLDDTVQMEDQGDRVVLRLRGKVLFAPGSARLTARADPVLGEIAKLLKMFDQYKIHIGGHSDDRPIKTARFNDNWELSALRATDVLRYLVRKGIDPARMTATGYADTDPLVANNSPENRAINRRVEIILEKKAR